MAFPAGSLTTLDDFNRADGTLQAGGGSTVWAGVGLGGGAAGWNVASNVAVPGGSGANHLSLFTVPANADLVFDAPTVGTTGQYIALFFRVQDGAGSWSGYWLFIETGGWTFRKPVTGVIGSGSNSALTSGDKIGIRAYGDRLEAYHYTSGAWNQTPVATATDAAIALGGPISLEAQGAWSLDNVSYFELLSDPGAGDGGGGDDPTEAVTIYVNGDTGSDSRNREVASDPATPVATLQAAALLAFANEDFADTISVTPAANADATNALDPRMYAPMHHNHTGGDILPFGDNTGNVPIRVQGVQGASPVDAWDKLPIIGQPLGAFKNWVFESADPDAHKSFQAGYDVGSGDDNLTIGSLRQVAQLEFHDILFTGGCYEVKVWDDVTFDGCWIRSPLSAFQGGGNRFLDGSGLHISYIDNSDGAQGVGSIRVLNCLFDTIQGEDAIQAYLGGVGGIYADAELVVDGCMFVNINGAGGFHTDSIQILGGTSYVITNNTFFGCDDAVIASDYHNGTIRFENNLCSGCGVPFQGQGTDLWIIRHNTFKGSFFGSSVQLGERTVGIVQKVIMVNNVIEDYFVTIAAENYDDDSIISHNAVIAIPGLQGIGVPEFGTSARMNDLPDSVDARPTLPRDYELANSPALSPGIGAGLVLDETNGGALATDRLGRAYSSPPDIGCHQSDPGTVVTPSPRAPYLVDRSPTVGTTNADPGVTVTGTFYPKPGEALNASTITTTSARVNDSRGQQIPAVVTVDDLDDAGQQSVRVDLKASLAPVAEGSLYPLETYTARFTGAIEDTEGSAFSEVSWTFKIAGPAGAAIYAGGSTDPNSFTLAADPRFHVGATVYLWRGGGGLLPFSPVPVTSAVVASDSTTTFTGLTQGTDYLAGFVVSGPFISFRT